jgi:hypothetical protein
LSKQRQIVRFLQENQVIDTKDDMFVTITLYRVPASLVREFAVKIAINYPGGIGDAVQDLMKKAITE